MNKYSAWGDINADFPHHFHEGVDPPTDATWDEESDGIRKLFWVIEAENWDDACIQYNGKQGWNPYVPMDGAEYARFRGFCSECGWPAMYRIQIGRDHKLFCSRHGNRKIKNCGLIHPNEKQKDPS